MVMDNSISVDVLALLKLSCFKVGDREDGEVLERRWLNAVDVVSNDRLIVFDG